MKKDAKITLMVIFFAVLLLLLGTTFAYYAVSTINKTTKATFNGYMERMGDVTLSNLTNNNFKLDFNSVDMAKTNEGYYYATNEENKKYALTEEDGTYNFAKVEVKGGEDHTNYFCTFDITVEMNGSMSVALESGDFLVKINGANLNTRLDLSKIRDTNKKVYNVSMNLHGNETKYIETFFRLKNKRLNQDYLKNTSMNVAIEASNLNCQLVSKTYMDITSENRSLSDILGEYTSNIKTIQFIHTIDSSIKFANGTTQKDDSIIAVYDVSELQNKNVIAWLKVNNEDTTKYDLYIGSKHRIYVKNLDNAFSGFESLTDITFENLDTSEVTSMNSMFNNCSSIKTLDLSLFDTSNVTNMGSMFKNASSVTNIIGIDKLNMGKVTDVTNMFYHTAFKEIDLSGWNLSSLENNFKGFLQNNNNLTKVTMSDIKMGNVNTLSDFLDSNNIEVIDLSNWDMTKLNKELIFKGITGTSNTDVTLNAPYWDVSNLTDLNNAFAGLIFKNIDLRGWNTEKVNNLTATFANNSKLINLNLDGWNTLNVTKMIGMFQNDSLLQNVNLDRWTAPNVTDMQAMFNGCNSLTELNLDDWDVHSVTNLTNMFAGCSSLAKISMNNWNLENVYSINIFNDNNNLQVIEMANWSIPKVSSLASLFLNAFSNLRIVDMKKLDAPELTSILNMFQDCPKLEQAEINGWNAPKLSNFTSLFKNCPSLTFVDLSEWTLNGSSNYATDMFLNCTNLQKINMDGWVIKNGSLALNNAFNNCPNLEEINISNWTISSSVYLTSTFSYNSKLKRVNMNNWNIESLTTLNSFLNFQIDSNEAELFVKNWNTPKVTNMSFLFNTNHFKSIDARDWNTPVLENVSNLFSTSRYVKYINMSNWDTSHVTNMSSMFRECPYLETLELNGLKSSNVTNFSNMFENTPNLKQIDLSEAEFTKANSYNDMFKNSNQNILIEAQDETNAKWIESRLQESSINNARVTRRIR